MNLSVNWPSWPVVLMHSRCFSLCPSASQVDSLTQSPIHQQLLIASLKWLGIIRLGLQCGLFSVWMSPDSVTVVGALALFWHSATGTCWHCDFLSQWSSLHTHQRVLITSSQSSWIHEVHPLYPESLWTGGVGRWRQICAWCLLLSSASAGSFYSLGLMFMSSSSYSIAEVWIHLSVSQSSNEQTILRYIRGLSLAKDCYKLSAGGDKLVR